MKKSERLIWAGRVGMGNISNSSKAKHSLLINED